MSLARLWHDFRPARLWRDFRPARLWRDLRPVLVGRTLAQAMDRNLRAAEGLDAAVREMLRR